MKETMVIHMDRNLKWWHWNKTWWNCMKATHCLFSPANCWKFHSLVQYSVMLICFGCVINWVFLFFCLFVFFTYLCPLFLSRFSFYLLFHTHPFFTHWHWSLSNSILNLLLFLSQIRHCVLKCLLHLPQNSFSVVPPPLPDTSPPPSAPRPIPRPGGRAPPDPLPSVSAAPQQIGGMVWDFLGKWVLCPGTSARLRG